MEIEILHIDDCPNWQEAGARVRQALQELGAPEVPVTFTLLSTVEEAAARPFAGSPTVLIDGVDAFPSDGATADLACRVYRVDPCDGCDDGERRRSLICVPSSRRRCTRVADRHRRVPATTWM